MTVQLSLWDLPAERAERRPFEERIVTDVDTVEAFCERYYRYDRYKREGEEYVQHRLECHRQRVRDFGFTILSKHESVTGEVVAFYPPESR